MHFNVDHQPFAWPEIILASVPVHLDSLLVTHTEMVAKLSTVLKMMTAQPTSSVIDFHILA